MRLNRKELLKELVILNGLVDHKTSLPILRGVALVTSSKGLRLHATDLTTDYRVIIPGEPASEIVGVVDTKTFLNYAKGSKIEDIMVEQEQDFLVIDRILRLPFIGSLDDFPQVKPEGEALSHKDEGQFVKALGMVTYAIDPDESRFGLNNLYLDGSTAFGCDGHRFAEAPFELPFDALLPASSIKNILKGVGKSATLVKQGRHLIIKQPRKRITVRLSDMEDFRDGRKQLNCKMDNDNVLIISQDVLNEALQAMKPLANEIMRIKRAHKVAPFCPMQLIPSMGDDQMTLKIVHAEAGELEQTIPCEFKRFDYEPDVWLGLNYQYLIDALKHCEKTYVVGKSGAIENGKLSISFGGIDRDSSNKRFYVNPVVIRKDGIEDFHAIMPMRP